MWEPDNKSEISCILATFILDENDIEISDNKITALLYSAGIKFENFWPRTFARLAKNFDIREIIGYQKNFQKNETQTNLPESIIKENKPDNSSSSKDSEDGDMGLGLFD